MTIPHTTAFVILFVEHRLKREIARWVHHEHRSEDPLHTYRLEDTQQLAAVLVTPGTICHVVCSSSSGSSSSGSSSSRSSSINSSSSSDSIIEVVVRWW